MPVEKFPDPSLADDDGVLAMGGDLHPDSLLLAYRNGIFPWPMDERAPMLWFSPPRRAVLVFEELHLPRSLSRARRRSGFRFTFDAAFEKVISACARVPRPGQQGTWITPAMKAAYLEFHRVGHAHSVETWEGDRLVGGIYGVDAGGAFAAESMFFEEPNASKLALLALIDHLRARGLGWLDIQMLTPHMERLGAREIPRDEFLRLLKKTLLERRPLF